MNDNFGYDPQNPQNNNEYNQPYYGVQPPVEPPIEQQPPAPPHYNNVPPGNYYNEGAYPPMSNNQPYNAYYNQAYNPAEPPMVPPPIPPQNNGPYEWNYANYENFEKMPKKKQNKGLIAFIIALVSCMLIGIVAMVTVTMMAPNNDLQGNQPPAITVPEKPAEGGDKPPVFNNGDTPASIRPKVVVPDSGERLTIPEVAAKVTPSVVGILRYENNALYEPTGLGSGIIVSVDEDGYAYVITNSHVVQYGTNFKVGLYDDTYLDAELVGADAQSDLAVLRIQGEGLIAAEIGDSNQLLVGETVIAIGNPVSLELSSSVTMGIVSAVDRTFDDSGIVDYIQTDAAINPGNSGGALANEYGQVIGVNTMKVKGVGYEGIGFSIPMNTAIPIVEELIQHGKVASRPAIGITGMEISEMKARQLESPAGIMVVELSPGSKFSPELKPQDIITHINGERILGLADLRNVLSEHRVDDTVELTVYRKTDTVKSEELEITATLISAQ